MILSLIAAQEKLMAGRWNRKAAYFLAINFPAFHPAGGRRDKDENADLKRSDGVVEYWSFQSSNAPLFHHSDSHRAMSINLLIGEGRGNRIMVGQNHCRNPAAEFIPPGCLHAASDAVLLPIPFTNLDLRSGKSLAKLKARRVYRPSARSSCSASA